MELILKLVLLFHIKSICTAWTFFYRCMCIYFSQCLELFNSDNSISTFLDEKMKMYRTQVICLKSSKIPSFNPDVPITYCNYTCSTSPSNRIVQLPTVFSPGNKIWSRLIPVIIQTNINQWFRYSLICCLTLIAVWFVLLIRKLFEGKDHYHWTQS